MRKKLMVANWKMHKTIKEAKDFIFAFNKLIAKDGLRGCTDMAICAPFLQLPALREAYRSEDGIVKVGAQNVHFEEQGAYTGEISLPMLMELAIDYVIVGHSERRQYFGETDESISQKLEKSISKGIHPILCVGENLEQREKGEAFSVVENQIKLDLALLKAENIKNLVIAYEPIWAIGTGKNASSDEAEEMCAFIRKIVAEMFGEESAEILIIQYGGSVKPENVAELMGKDNIDGALVGGASLDAESFYALVSYAKK